MAPTATTAEATNATICDPREELAQLLVRVERVLGRIDPDAVLARHAPKVWDLCDHGAKLFVGAQTQIARRVDDSGVYKKSGSRNTAEYLALRSGTSNQAAAEMLVTSRALPGLPATEAAVRSGQLSSTQAHYIASAAACTPREEAALLALVTGSGGSKASNKELRDEALQVKHAADPDPEATRRRHRRERYVRQGTTVDGGWWFAGRGTTDDANRFNAALNPVIEEIFRQARDEGRTEPREAYAYDGLQELARRAITINNEGVDRPAQTARRRPNLSLLPVIRIDLAALHRGLLLPR